MLTNGTRFLEYDDEDQLIRITEPNSWKSEFVYDGKHRRRIRKEYVWQLGAFRLATEVRYIYDGNFVLQERDASNLGLVGYTRSGGRPSLFSGGAGLLGFSQFAGSSTRHYFYHVDANGNETALIDQLQLTKAKYSYDPYGNTVAISGPLAKANVRRFSSKEVHTGSGLTYFLFRYYGSEIQRWLNCDPIGIRGGVNLYRMAKNDPINHSDPRGLFVVGDISDGTQNTIVCMGGAVAVQLGSANDPNANPAVVDCAREHEQSHAADANAFNPDLCADQPDNSQILYNRDDGGAEANASERKGYGIERCCLAGSYLLGQISKQEYDNRRKELDAGWAKWNLSTGVK